MLKSLSIRNIVLIEAVDVGLEDGLTVVTGETGAGKSVVLDSLGLVLGARADKGLIRSGQKSATVAAVFDLPPSHPVYDTLVEMGLEDGDEDVPSELILRRTIGQKTAGRAFVNDRPVSLATMRTIGAALVEVHGQHDDRGLLNPAGHRDLLDAFGKLAQQVKLVAKKYDAWQRAEDALADRLAAKARAEAEADYINLASEELTALAPEDNEEDKISEERGILANASRIAVDLKEADELLSGDRGLEGNLSAALRRLERAPAEAAGFVKPAADAIDRVLIELSEARGILSDQLRTIRHDPSRLEALEDRLYALRAAARKYRVAVSALPAKWAELEAARRNLESSDEDVSRLRDSVDKTKSDYKAACDALSAARRQAGRRLDKIVNGELDALRLAQAAFSTVIKPVDLTRAGPGGVDRVEFQVRTNEGSSPGPLSQIASGGELSRFILALKAALAEQGSATTLVFDEIDRGIGGAVADAVGERLENLARSAQVLVVTHSPQVAARGKNHFIAAKSSAKKTTQATLQPMGDAERVEEVARMLSGAHITDEARAQAVKLMTPKQTGKPAKPAKRTKPSSRKAS